MTAAALRARLAQMEASDAIKAALETAALAGMNASTRRLSNTGQAVRAVLEAQRDG